ncbi:hypothetical protein HYS54_03955 [Candidatus Micrarchaeota archaeon]|nr:hypothetical protein [Candidatus Micrarchaeota archaeon]
MLKKVVGKKPDEEKERERINFIKELLASQVLVKPTHSDWARAIAHNYSVDSIVVSRKDGSVLMSNTDKAFERAVKTSSLYEYTRSEFPKAEMLLVKDGDDYNIVYPHGDMIYVLKSSASLSPTETEKIVEQLRAGLNGQNAPRETALAVS